MQLKPLYTVRFVYQEDWETELTGPGGKEEFHFLLARGTCSGRISGKFRGANHPRRRTDHTFGMDLQGVIETDDGAVLAFDYQGYGRAYPAGRRQIVGAAWHISSDKRFQWLNDTICTLAGEVRWPQKPPDQVKQEEVELVIDVSELIWEAPTA